MARAGEGGGGRDKRLRAGVSCQAYLQEVVTRELIREEVSAQAPCVRARIMSRGVGESQSVLWV
jgi:hypothetical protein